MPFPRKFSSRFAGVLAAAALVALLALFIFAPGQAAASGADNWQASYWNNRDLQGQPALMRWEQAIDHDWHGLSPDPSINVDNFSARWVRSLNFPAGTYTFRATMDDGMRVWVDGRLIIDSWIESNVRTIESAVWLNSGSHRIVVEYFEKGGNAVAGFTWSPNDGQGVMPPVVQPPVIQPPTILPPGVIAPTAEVKAAFLNVRSAPGASQPVVAVLRQNTLVRMQARSSGGGWILINTDGVQGWVNKNYLHTDFPFTSLPTQGTTSPQPPVNPLPPAGNSGMVNSSMLNVRSGPGVAFPVIAVLRGGTQVSVIESNANGWLRVGIPGAGQGWVNGRYITR